MSDYRKPLPLPNDISRPFWEAAQRHQFMLQYCEVCSRYIHPPKPQCPRCFEQQLLWRVMSGRGEVHTFTVIYHTGMIPGFEPSDVPYAAGLIELDEQPGLRFLSAVVGCDPDDVRVGMPVQAQFDDVTPDVTLVKFRPA